MVILNQKNNIEQLFPIVEIFHSVQGEGYHSGIPSIFIRFGGCNLRCPWCDTDFDTWTDMSIAEIVNELSKYDCDRIIFTGGEPALQDLVTLSGFLKPLGYYLSIETNGTIEIPSDTIDWICVSPKKGAKFKLKYGNELKLVYPQEEFNPDRFKELEFDHFFLQPMDGEDLQKNILQSVSYCIENPLWRLSLQTHKIMGID